MFSVKKLEKQFTDFVSENDLYQEALELVRMNSEEDSNIWLIGGFLSRNLANILYGSGEPEKADLDFLVENAKDTMIVPTGWELKKNSFGGDKFIRGNIEVDLVPLDIVYFIRKNGAEPTLENFLKYPPLDIQSLVYNTNTGQLLGECGINSLRNKTIIICYKEAAENEARRKGLGMDDYLGKIAKSFNFEIG